MGIRFRCHHCEHDLNLKDFQAGRRARCPSCSGRFRVPTRSADFSLPLEESEAEMAATGWTANAAQRGPTFELQQPSSEIEQRPQSVASYVPNKEQSGPTGTPDSANNLGSRAEVDKRASNESVQSSSTPESNQAVNPPEARSKEVLTSQTGPTKGSPVLPRAIAEAPQAVWYVRPPSGGQYGPADGNVFYQWMLDNRVARDALVWRDGWPQWMIAGEAFEDYFGSAWRVPEALVPSEESASIRIEDSIQSNSELASQTNVAVSSSLGEVEPLAYAAGTTGMRNVTAPVLRRKKNRANHTLLIMVLAVLAFALVGVLLVVVLGK